MISTLTDKFVNTSMKLNFSFSDAFWGKNTLLILNVKNRCHQNTFLIEFGLRLRIKKLSKFISEISKIITLGS